jgi:hypothetical protein
MATAGIPPADLCSLLPAAEVSKILGKTYDSPQKSIAPPSFPPTAAGTDCKYQSRDGSQLRFIAYADPSSRAAALRFAKLTEFFRGPRPVKKGLIPGLREEAYFDESSGLLVRKGRVRFYITLNYFINNQFINGNFGSQQQLINLANRVSDSFEGSDVIS